MGSKRIGSSVVDFSTREVTARGTVQRLEPRAADVLSCLVEARGAVLSRESLLDRCWPEHEGSDEALTQAIAQIRRAFGDNSRNPAYVETIPKAGYRLVASTEDVERQEVARPATSAPFPPGLSSPPVRWPRRIDIRMAALLVLCLVTTGALAVLLIGGAPQKKWVTKEVLILKGAPPGRT